MVSDAAYFSHLYEIASSLNREVSLHSALRKALEKTVQLLELETGWIWMMQGDKTVYLAASYNLPPALREHPERLSGRCYCIEKYLANNLDKAKNVSEIVCTRLKNIRSGTYELKFHATIPINIGNQKVGLINLLSKESQQLNDKQLNLLNTIGELVGIVIQRTQIQETGAVNPFKSESSLNEVLSRVFYPKLNNIVSTIEKARLFVEQDNISDALASIDQSLKESSELTHQISHVINEGNHPPEKNTDKQLRYPASPLTDRELEILSLVKKGYTNKQIAESVFISERTVKFHITSILSKLFASTRTEAVDIALKRGLISF